MNLELIKKLKKKEILCYLGSIINIDQISQ